MSIPYPKPAGRSRSPERLIRAAVVIILAAVIAIGITLALFSGL